MKTNILLKFAAIAISCSVFVALAFVSKSTAGHLPSVSVTVSYGAVAVLLALAAADYRVAQRFASSR